MNSVPILVCLNEDEDDQTKGIFSPGAEIVIREIPTKCLQENLSKLCKEIVAVIGDIKAIGHFKLSQVTMQVEVTAEGGVELIGTAKLGGKGAITLTFSD